MSYLTLEPSNFRKMIERSVELLRTQLAQTAKRRSVEPLEVELGDPLSDAELAAVEAQLGCSLDPRFVALFRSVNGFRVACGTRRAHVRPLRELLGGPPTQCCRSRMTARSWVASPDRSCTLGLAR